MFSRLPCFRRSPRRSTLLARAYIPQKLPGIEPELVAVVPLKFDCVLADRFRLGRLGGCLEHGQRPGRGFGRLPGLAAGFRAFFVTQSAGAGIAQEGKRVMRAMSVLPLDVHARAGGQAHFNRLGIRTGHHEISIAQGERCYGTSGFVP